MPPDPTLNFGSQFVGPSLRSLGVQSKRRTMAVLAGLFAARCLRLGGGLAGSQGRTATAAPEAPLPAVLERARSLSMFRDDAAADVELAGAWRKSALGRGRTLAPARELQPCGVKLSLLVVSGFHLWQTPHHLHLICHRGNGDLPPREPRGLYLGCSDIKSIISPAPSPQFRITTSTRAGPSWLSPSVVRRRAGILLSIRYWRTAMA
jgi:hypothetical protein